MRLIFLSSLMQYCLPMRRIIPIPYLSFLPLCDYGKLSKHVLRNHRKQARTTRAVPCSQTRYRDASVPLAVKRSRSCTVEVKSVTMVTPRGMLAISRWLLAVEEAAGDEQIAAISFRRSAIGYWLLAFGVRLQRGKCSSLSSALYRLCLAR